MKKKGKYNVAIVGGTGGGGNELLDVLEERGLPVGDLKFFASERSAGETLPYKEEEFEVDLLGEKVFHGVDIALFSAGEKISLEFAPRAVEAGAVVIDNSSAFRMDPQGPLVGPEGNPGAC